MRNILISVFIAVVLFSCNNSEKGPGFSVDGEIRGIDEGTVYLQIREAEEWVTIDSTELDGGKFYFEGSVDQPKMAYISLSDRGIQIPFFIENSQMDFSVSADSLSRPKVTGSKAQEFYYDLLDDIEPVNKAMSDLHKKYRETKDEEELDTAYMKQLFAQYDSVQNEMDQRFKKYIMEYPNSVVTAYLAVIQPKLLTVDELKSVVDSFNENLPENDYVEKLNERYEILNASQPGKMAPDFTTKDSADHDVSLSDFKGKYVLLFYYADWNRDIFSHIPQLRECYEKNKDNFEILNISFDKSKNNWFNSLRKRKLPGVQVNDLKEWETEAALKYGIYEIPYLILIGPDGKIIDRDMEITAVCDHIE